MATTAPAPPPAARTIAGFLLAPLAVVSVYAALLSGELGSGRAGLFTPAQILLGVFLTAAVVEALVLVPLFLFSARVRAAGLPAYVAAGAALGLTLALLLNIGGAPAAWTYYAACTGAAALGVAVFWIVRNGFGRRAA